MKIEIVEKYRDEEKRQVELQLVISGTSEKEENGRVCLETRKVAFQAPASGARDAPPRADSGLPGPPSHPPVNDASPVSHLDPCSPAQNPSGLREGQESGTQGVARPTTVGQPLKRSPVSSASAPILK